MADAPYSPKDALIMVQGRSLEDWLNSQWDLLCSALNYYQASLDPDNEDDQYTSEAIRRARMEIVVGNRLSDVVRHQHTELAGQTELPNICQSEGARG